MQERLHFLGGPPVGSDLILLVEDNPDDVKQTLASFAKHRIGNPVVVARDGAEALDYLFASGAHAGRDPTLLPGLILLDLKLPRIGGLQVLSRLREDPRTRHVPVVILTSSSEEQDRVRSYSEGANIFVRKPVDLTSILTAARSLGLYWSLLHSGLTLIHQERRPARDGSKVNGPAKAPVPARAPPTETARQRGAEVVLGVHDDELRRLITTLLRVDGHHVRAGKNARDTFRLLYSQLPDILVVDNALSDINGIEIVRALRQTPHGQAVTPILLSDDTAAAQADLRDPRVHVLPTPVDVLRLWGVVRGVFPVHAPTSEPSQAPTAWDLLGIPRGATPEAVAEAADVLVEQLGDLERRTGDDPSRALTMDATARVRAARSQLIVPDVN